MGQKVNPNIFRIGYSSGRAWNSKFYASKRSYGELVIQDFKIRELINSKCKVAGVSSIKLSRTTGALIVDIYARKVGVIVGKDGVFIEELRGLLQKIVDLKLSINIIEVKNPFIDPSLMSRQIADQLKKRSPVKKVMKSVAENCIKSGAEGVKIKCSGRLGGVEIAKSEVIKLGRVRLHTLRSNIVYFQGEVVTMQGVIGIKIWVAKGKLFRAKSS